MSAMKVPSTSGEKIASLRRLMMENICLTRRSLMLVKTMTIAVKMGISSMLSDFTKSVTAWLKTRAMRIPIPMTVSCGMYVARTCDQLIILIFAFGTEDVIVVSF